MGNKLTCLGRGRNQNSGKKRLVEEKKRYKKMLVDKEAEILTEDQEPATNGTKAVRSQDFSDGLDLGDLRAQLQRMCSTVDPVDSAALQVEPENHLYPFENLVFEGGGNKGLAYVGCIQCLEDLGMMSQIRRVAGASAGAITAALVALGYTSDDIFTFLSDNIEEVFLDHSCGYLSLLPNLVSKFGWNPGTKIYNWFGDKIKVKTVTGNPDLTFYELYKEKKMELCVVVTNLNQMRAEYCHPKTTPDMPIRDALRMSMAIPGVFSPRIHDNHGQKDTYVDGGVLCNYPIHCYDGWFLSMAKGDALLLRMHPLKNLPSLMDANNRFGKYNPKTMGFLLFDDGEMEVMRYSLESRIGCLEPKAPTSMSKLYLEKVEKKKKLDKAELEHSRVVRAIESFMQVLHKHNLQEEEFIDKTELEAALKDTTNFPREQAELLFGKDVNTNTAFSILDKDGNGKVAFMELVQFIEEHGIRMQTRFQGYGRREVKTFVGFLSALQATLLTNMKYVFVGDHDEDRTVGINTGHIGTSDYCLDSVDRVFVCERGYNATKTFLRYFTVKFPELVKDKPKATTTTATPGDERVAECAEVVLTEGEHIGDRTDS